MSQSSHRRRVTVHRAARVVAAVLAVMMLLLPMLSVPVAAQTNETNPCAFGPPVPSGAATTDGSGGLEVGISIDRTDSMNFENRLSEAKTATKAFVGNLSEPDEITVSTYESTVDPVPIIHPLNTNYSGAQAAIDDIQAGQGGGGDFAIAEGINVTATELTNSTNATVGAQKAMVIVTDSKTTTQDAIAAGEAARDQGIATYAVGVGPNIDEQWLTNVTGSSNRVYTTENSSDLTGLLEDVRTDIEAVESGLRIDTRDLFKPGATHEFDVYNVTFVAENNRTTRLKEEVTANATLTSSNSTVLSVDNVNNTLTAASDPNTSTWVRVNAVAVGETGCTNVIVAKPTLQNLRLVPGIWRVTAVIGNSTLFALLIATLLAVPMARFSSAFGGLALAQMVMVLAWFAGYVSFGTAAASLFIALFIGLNLAANIDYGIQRGR